MRRSTELSLLPLRLVFLAWRRLRSVFEATLQVSAIDLVFRRGVPTCQLDYDLKQHYVSLRRQGAKAFTA